MFAFLFVDVFDTLGTLIGCADKADMLDKEGKLPRIRPALLADAIATSAGAVLGTSTTTTFVESSSGVSAGGRTGLTSVVTGLLFLVSLILSPLFISIPGFATAPALVFVGFLMMSAITGIDLKDPTESIPAFLSFLIMPLVYSISDGIMLGTITYVLLNALTGNGKKISYVLWALAILFVMRYTFM
jgi:AGZA family xanthine/uracil permease-like MFS transporter